MFLHRFIAKMYPEKPILGSLNIYISNYWKELNIHMDVLWPHKQSLVSLWITI